ncbi:hypothetical protein BN988_03814 [Oceanobacillus picturae]|uniref:Uncharacterized protein n=1 Tax=Oceanobacillus picturae TaxID=171693 RepID=W9AHN1_9BACI|nr:hypothetical protein [Oceanobacillus picturae]CDO05224.1 hypothetical protein BN988_03814 [Oceanobacillus picturae]
MLKKIGLVVMSLVLLMSLGVPGVAQASSIYSKVTKEQVENTEVLIDVINELDQKLDMENLSSNSQEEVNKLSKEAKELYNSILNYSDQKTTSLTENDALVILSMYVNKDTGEITKNKESTIQPMGVINYKEYKISNAKINKLVKLAGLHGGFWATATAIAKVFGKSPTALTLMIAAVPVLGVAGLNNCNSKGKGVIITKIGSGATNSYFCSSQ